MTDDLDTKGGQVGGSGDGDSQSSRKGDSATSTPDLEALATKLRDLIKPDIETAVERTFQSGKDKRFQKVDALTSKLEWLTQIEQLEKEGMTRDQIKDMLWKQEVEARLSGSQAGGVGNTTENVTIEQAKKYLEQAGIELNDPQVTELFKKKPTLDDVFNLTVTKLKKPAPDLSGAPPIPAGGTSPDKSSELHARYRKDLQAMGKATPAQIADLKAKYRKEGLDIW